jgi:predicted TIM-barrel fold metal-dependent hydrolase
MERLLLISADNHVGAGPAAYLPYVEDRFKTALMELRAEEHDYLSVFIPFSTFADEVLEHVDTRHAIRSGGTFAALSSKERLKQLDAEGVAAEIVHPGHQNAMTPWFSQINAPYPAQLRAAGVRAYHRWLADDMAQGEGRVFGVAEPGPCLDMDATIAELHWVADHGFVSVAVPGSIRHEPIPPLHDRSFDRFWATCEERSLVLSIHAGWGAVQGSFFQFRDRIAANPEIVKRIQREGKAAVLGDLLRNGKESPFQLNLGSRRAFWQLALGGVFDRHPDLRLCLTEIRADWIPDTLVALDREFDAGRFKARLKPSEYFRKHVWVTPSSPRRTEILDRHAIGLDHFMFGVDFPHSEGTWPNSADWILSAFEDVPDAEARKILGENAIECYRLPGAALRAVADRIGLPVGQVLGTDRKAPAPMVAHFTARAGYNYEREVVDTESIRNAVAEDMVAVNA